MSDNASTIWGKVFKVLSASAAQTPAGTKKAASSTHSTGGILSAAAAAPELVAVVTKATTFYQLPKLPRSMWKHLIVESKVPKKLGLACSAATPAQHNIAAAVCLHRFLTKAIVDGVTTSKMESSTLINSFVQQLQQSQILQQLPVLLDTAAQQLASLQESPALLFSTCKGHTAAAIEQGPGLEQHAQLVFMQRAVSELLSLQNRLQAVSPVLDAGSRALAAPSVHLAVAALQHFSCCVDVMPADAGPPVALDDMALAAYRAAVDCVAKVDPERPSTMQGLAVGTSQAAMLQTPACEQAVYILLLLGLLAPPEATAASLSAEQAWEVAGAAPAVSQRQQQLLHAVGCSGKALQYLGVQTNQRLLSPALLGSWQDCAARNPDTVQTDLQSSAAAAAAASGAGNCSLPLPPAIALTATTPARQLDASHAAISSTCGTCTTRSTAVAVHAATSSTSARLSHLMLAELMPWAAQQDLSDPSIQCSTVLQTVMLACAHVLSHLLLRYKAHCCLVVSAKGSGHEPTLQHGIAQDSTAAALQAQEQSNVAAQLEAMGFPWLLASVEREAKASAGFPAKAWLPMPVEMADCLSSVGSLCSRVVPLLQKALREAHSSSSTNSSSSSSAVSSRTNEQPSTLYSFADSMLGVLCLNTRSAVPCCVSVKLESLKAGTTPASTKLPMTNPAQLEASSDNSSSSTVEDDSSVLSTGSADGMQQLQKVWRQHAAQVTGAVEAYIRTTASAATDQDVKSLLSYASTLLLADTQPMAQKAAPSADSAATDRAVQHAPVFPRSSAELKQLFGLTLTALKAWNRFQSRGLTGLAQTDDLHDFQVSTPGSVTPPANFAGPASQLKVNFVSSVVLQGMYRRVWAEVQPAQGSGSSASPCDNIASTELSDSSSSKGSSTLCQVCNSGIGSSSSDGSSIGESTEACPAGSSGGSSDSQTVHALLEAALPGCCLLGRYILLCTKQQQRAPTAMDSLPTSKQDAMHHSSSVNSAILSMLQESKLLCSYLQRGEGLLSAAGYAVGPALQLWQDTAQAAQATDVAGWDADSSQRFLQQLHELGVVLSALPISSACNNPYCCNLDGLSEQQLVTGSSRKCSACRTARYCSPACQSAHWPQHRTTCKALRAAAAGKKAASSRTLAAGSAQP